MILWSERGVFVIKLEKGKAISGNDNSSSEEISSLESQISELMSRNQEYYGVQDNWHKNYHPEYGPHPESEYYLVHCPQPGRAKLAWVRKH